MKRVIGLMSGTSADAIDAALVEIGEDLGDLKVDLCAFKMFPWRAHARQKILDALHADTAELARLNVYVSRMFAAAAMAVANQAGVPLESIDLIGCHGQTIYHQPKDEMYLGIPVRTTVQLGDASIIAELTGVTTVANFRLRDMAAGGVGAPLVPYVDWLLFRDRSEGRVLLNIGGIANITALPAGCPLEKVIAFDTGPGNVLIDGLIQELTSGQELYDLDGASSRKGKIIEALLEELLHDDYFEQTSPKAIGREYFTSNYLKLLMKSRFAAEDLLRTAVELTARTVADAIRAYAGATNRVIVSGGGANNSFLMERLSAGLEGFRVDRIDALGIPADAKEAVAFAVLAHQTIAGHANNVPSATGASHPVVLGVIAPGRSGSI